MKNIDLGNSSQNTLKYLDMINNINIAIPILNIAGLFISNPNKIVTKATMNTRALNMIVLANISSGLININTADNIINTRVNNSYFEDLEAKKPLTEFTIIKITGKTINTILVKKYNWKSSLANSSRINLSEITLMVIKTIKYPNILKIAVKGLINSLL
jgi:hypothetical protein